MNIKIYSNNKFIQFSDSPNQSPHDQQLRTEKGLKGTALKKAVMDVVLSSEATDLQLSGVDFEESLGYLKKNFYYIEAAGGMIRRADQYLCIHRFGRWDLPKGKLEKNEAREHAAVRECEEECAVQGLSIVRELQPTFHIYAYKDGYALKQTFWYLMKTDYNGALKPQIEESIDEVRWFNEKGLREIVLSDTYYTISDVIREVIG